MSDPRTLYDDDILLWSEQQAAAIRDLGRRRGMPNDIDIENVAEEIEGVGRSELAAVKGQARQIFIHLMKLVLEPASDAARHWKSELVAFHAELIDRYAPSMRQRIELDAIWLSARDQTVLACEGTELLRDAERLPEAAPLTIVELVEARIDPAVLIARVEAAMGR